MNGVSNTYYRVRNTYATEVTPVRRIQPVENERSNSLIQMSNVSDSISISGAGRQFVNAISKSNEVSATETVNRNINESNVPASVQEIQKGQDVVSLSLDTKPNGTISSTNNQNMSARTQMAISAYKKVMDYVPDTLRSGALLQSLM